VTARGEQPGPGTSDSYMARLGARLVDNGYPVLPIMPGTKKPGQFKRGAWRDYPGWTKHGTRPTSEHELIVWSGWPDAGIGIPTGTVIGVDIDIREAKLASRLEQLARETLGDTPAVRFGLPPKRLLVYRAAERLSGMKTHPIEVLGLGQQFVAFADHPETKRPYDWPQESPADLPAESLPPVDETMIRAFLDQTQAVVPPELRPGRLPGGSTARAEVTAAGDRARSRAQRTPAPCPSSRAQSDGGVGRDQQPCWQLRVACRRFAAECARVGPPPGLGRTPRAAGAGAGHPGRRAGDAGGARRRSDAQAGFVG
jgi:Bifunctional DNA primase/polymerase, N-terminal